MTSHGAQAADVVKTEIRAEAISSRWDQFGRDLLRGPFVGGFVGYGPLGPWLVGACD